MVNSLTFPNRLILTGYSVLPRPPESLSSSSNSWSPLASSASSNDTPSARLMKTLTDRGAVSDLPPPVPIKIDFTRTSSENLTWKDVLEDDQRRIWVWSSAGVAQRTWINISSSPNFESKWPPSFSLPGASRSTSSFVLTRSLVSIDRINLVNGRVSSIFRPKDWLNNIRGNNEIVSADTEVEIVAGGNNDKSTTVRSSSCRKHDWY